MLDALIVGVALATTSAGIAAKAAPTKQKLFDYPE
jgi:hypothetical protein